MYQEIFFYIILGTAITGMPMPEICFLPGQLRRTILPNERSWAPRRFTQWPWIERSTIRLRGGQAIAASTKCSSPMP